MPNAILAPATFSPKVDTVTLTINAFILEKCSWFLGGSLTMKPYCHMRCFLLSLVSLGTVGMLGLYRWNLSLDLGTTVSKFKTSDFNWSATDTLIQMKPKTVQTEDVLAESAPSTQTLGYDPEDDQLYKPSSPEDCNMDACVTFSLCSLSRPFSFYLYPHTWLQKNSEGMTTALSALLETFSENENRVEDPADACIYIVLIDLCNSKQTDALADEKLYHDGKNHIFWTHCSAETVTGLNFTIPMHSMLASESFANNFRTNFDLVVSHWESVPPHFGDSWINIPQIFPIRRKYLAGFAGCHGFHLPTYIELRGHQQRLNYDGIQNNQCNDETLRKEILQESIFSVIILPFDDLSTVTRVSIQRQIYKSLNQATIPVVVGARFSAPFHEVLDWSKVIITIPMGRLNQLPMLLDAISDSEIVAFKKHGRLFLEKYLGSLKNIVDTFLGTIRTRFGLAPRPFLPVDFEHVHDDASDNGLSYPDLPTKSVTYVQNYSVNYQRKYEAWNEHFQPFRVYPNTPWEQDIRLQTSGRFFTEDFNGTEISAPKGDRLRFFEQFTVVIMTYKRHEVLVKNLKRLNGLKFLHKVVIVWNELDPPPESLEWPEISAPIVVIFPRKNSLNNKYLPYDEIETEAVLALDDEIQFENEELEFGFHVWTENRDRLVGYMARYHSWDEKKKSWIYTWNDDCEISMTLTCATFFHKIYLYKYTYEMPEIIRRTVDQQMNCDDLAMNFLISHVSKKPPIKVTPKRSFTYPGATGGISSGSKHLQKRHNCLNLFSEVYGYMPLRFTILRADSMLYNSKAHGKFKAVCFNKV